MIISPLDANKKITYAAAVVSRERIDEINILQAAMEAMAEAVLEVDTSKAQQLQGAGETELNKDEKRGFVLVDGNRIPKQFSPHLSDHARAVVKGDGLEYIIAAASVS